MVWLPCLSCGYGQVVRFDTVTGPTLGVVADTVSGGPMGLALDSGAHLYTANLVNRMIAKFTPEGSPVIRPPSRASLGVSLFYSFCR